MDAEHLLRQAEVAAMPVMAATAAKGRKLSHIRGIHGRRRPGDGDDFWQYRTYQQGDAAQAIDWRRSSRSDTLYVREREWEAAQNLYFWCDASPSMDYASSPSLPRKLDRARLITLSLAVIFSQGGERVAPLGGTPRAGRFGLIRMAEEMLRAPSSQFPQTPRLAAGSHVILISDFLDTAETTQAHLLKLMGHGISGHLVRVLDPVEEDFPFKGRVRFEGLEGERSETLNRAEELRAAYRTKMAALSDTLIALTRHMGWSFTTHRNDHSVTPCLLSTVAHIAEQQGAE